jgi:hypothetical protein
MPTYSGLIASLAARSTVELPTIQLEQADFG